MINQKKCPNCGGKLEQHFARLNSDHLKVIGGPSTSSPSILSGCYCTSCGIKFTFNVAGKCPNCKGTGQYKYITYLGGIEQHSYSSTCPTCKGKGCIK